MQLTDYMIERAAKVLRREEYPAKIDPRPWRQVIDKQRFRKRARRVLRAALKNN